ncbi:pentapeptide repeat-containing protein [uncultured Gemmiger sp.]|uniref:pentapeptide repeat-containing protein n=1 Tax=uncultured Gemmiger sp. TaxID=1623490 RepID=UPI0025FE3196|nr:pentapeptide repeat-containing protein [uncultured Gemmiger sp.]
MRHTNEAFDGQNLTGSLQGQEFFECTFTRCRWQELRVENCTFAGCRFVGCQWSNVVFSFTQMREGCFAGCAFRGIAWGGLQGKSALARPLAETKNCMFQYNDFSGMALAGYDFSSCEFRDCRFDSCKLAGADFNGVRLGESQFTRCALDKADFRDAQGYVISPADNTLKGARFSFPDVVRLLDGTGIRIE